MREAELINLRAPARRTLNVWPDAARVLGVSRGTAYALAKSGALPTIKLGRRLLVPVARLDELLGERKP